MTNESEISESADIIVYEQRGLIVCNKPGGLLTQAPPGIDSLETRLKNFLRARDNLGAKFYLTPIHRLDRPVTGLVAFARNVRAAKRVSAQFQQRTVQKSYIAMVEGSLPDASGTLEDFMRKIPDQAKSEIAQQHQPNAKHAQLEYNVLDSHATHTRVEIRLITGRTHQIRLQFSSRGHAILGDELYGASQTFGPKVIDLRKRQIALHSWKLKLRHPIDDQDVDLQLPPPATWTVANDGT